MPIKGLLADDSDAMRSVIAKLINEEPSTELIDSAHVRYWIKPTFTPN
jgi:hypothetical protein